MEIRYPTCVEPLEDYRLLLTFDNGERRVFDVTPYLDSKLFAPLRNPALFKTVRLNPITIEWIGDIDIAPEELYIDSIPASSP